MRSLPRSRPTAFAFPQASRGDAPQERGAYVEQEPEQRAAYGDESEQRAAYGDEPEQRDAYAEEPAAA